MSTQKEIEELHRRILCNISYGRFGHTMVCKKYNGEKRVTQGNECVGNFYPDCMLSSCNSDEIKKYVNSKYGKAKSTQNFKRKSLKIKLDK